MGPAQVKPAMLEVVEAVIAEGVARPGGLRIPAAGPPRAKPRGGKMRPRGRDDIESEEGTAKVRQEELAPARCRPSWESRVLSSCLVVRDRVHKYAVDIHGIGVAGPVRIS